MKNRIFIIALAGLAIAACQKENVQVSTSDDNAGRICASISPDTKTALNDNHITWTDNDKIKIAYFDSENITTRKYTLERGSGSTRGIFKLTDGGEQPDPETYVFALYCADNIVPNKFLTVKVPYEQYYKESGISNNTLPMFTAGKVSDDLNFEPSAAVLRFKVYGMESGMTLNEAELTSTSLISSDFTYQVSSAPSYTYIGESTNSRTYVKLFDIKKVLATTESGALDLNIVVGVNKAKTIENLTLKLTFSNGSTFTIKKESPLSVDLGKLITFPAVRAHYSNAVMVKVDDEDWIVYNEDITTPTKSIAVKSESAVLTSEVYDVIKNKIANSGATIDVDLSGINYHTTTIGLNFSKYTTDNGATYKNAENIGTIKLPKNIEKIDVNAFNPFYGSAIYIPASVSSIRDDSFRECYIKSSCNIIVDKANETYKNIGDDGYVYSKDGLTLVATPAYHYTTTPPIVVPEGIVNCYGFSFHTGTKNLTISSTVKDAGTIYACHQLCDITINAVNPPVVAAPLFNGSDAGNKVVSGPKTIHVPVGTVSDYKHSTWGQFESLGWVIDDGTQPTKGLSASIDGLGSKKYDDNLF